MRTLHSHGVLALLAVSACLDEPDLTPDLTAGEAALPTGARTLQITFETSGQNLAYVVLEDTVTHPPPPGGTLYTPPSTCKSVVGTVLDGKPLATILEPATAGLPVRTVGTGTPA